MQNTKCLIKDFEGKKSGVKEFQKKTVKNLGYKYYVEDKNKLLLADEVGMGKTYVCRGLIELGQQICGGKKSKEPKEPFTVVYIAPNDSVAKQNLSELCDGFIEAKKKRKIFKNERLSALEIKKEGDYYILSFSAGMFFSENKGTTGRTDERMAIGKKLIAVFMTLYCSKSKEDRETVKKYDNLFELIISALANSSSNGRECRYQYFSEDNPKRIETELLRDFRSQYIELRENSRIDFGGDREEAKFLFQQVQEEFDEYIDTLNRVVEYIEAKSEIDINSFIASMYLLQCGKEEVVQNIPDMRIDSQALTYLNDEKKREMAQKICDVREDLNDLKKCVFLNDEKKRMAKEKILPLLIPYYVNKYDDYYKIVSSFFEKIRYIINLNNYRKLSPDLIILDEFHKYFSVAVREKLKTYLNLGDKDTKVLLVSATPYKMSLKSVDLMSEYLDEYDMDDADEGGNGKNKGNSKREDGENCFSGYQDVYNFLSGSEGEEISKLFAETVTNLKSLSKENIDKIYFEELWNKCKDNKDKMQSILEQYVVRTERSTLLKSVDSKIELINEANKDFTKEEMFHDCKMVSSLWNGGVGINNALLYTKMSPYPMSFSDGYISLGFPINDKNVSVFETGLKKYASNCFWDGSTIPQCYRLRMLMEKFGWNPDVISSPVTKALWIPSAKSNGLKGFWNDIKNLSKFLVFARHIMTIKSVSAILSVQPRLTRIQPMPDKWFDDIKERIDMGKNSAGDAGQGILYACFYQGIIRGSGLDIENAGLKMKNELVETAKDCTQQFISYLKEHKTVLSNAGVTDEKSLYDYCSNGDLCSVIEEYVFVLTKGHFSDDTWDRVKSLKEAFEVEKTGEVSYYCNDDVRSKKTVKCGIANMYSEQNGDKDYVIKAFNSPFYPFIMMTTPIAQEGLNFQYYSHNTFHWRTPVSPIDYEQREGRVNRYRNHAVRKSIVAKAKNNEFGADAGNLSWRELFEKATKYSVAIKCDHGGLNPDWITDGENNTSEYLKSYIIVHPESRELKVERVLEDAINNYRVSLGYGISNEIVVKIKEQAESLGIKDCDINDILINLSPKELLGTAENVYLCSG